jgi:hypothetical protein
MVPRVAPERSISSTVAAAHPRWKVDELAEDTHVACRVDADLGFINANLD